MFYSKRRSRVVGFTPSTESAEEDDKGMRLISNHQFMLGFEDQFVNGLDCNFCFRYMINKELKM